MRPESDLVYTSTVAPAPAKTEVVARPSRLHLLLDQRAWLLLFGLALLAIVYRIGRLLYGPRVGLFAALLLAVSGSFLYSAHMARHDVIVAAFGYGAVALYLSNASGDDRRWVLSLRRINDGLP